MPAHRLEPAVLERFRQMEPEEALQRLGIHCKRDPTFRPARNSRTIRLLVGHANQAFELLATGPKWFDPKADRGGGGAIDLVMHVLRKPFVPAVATLIAATRVGATKVAATRPKAMAHLFVPSPKNGS